ncbi:hypothetical protein A5881_000959 [Enterococcus termitis]|nr:hypothetical protein A5881_001170 [Enterococcus termitis]
MRKAITITERSLEEQDGTEHFIALIEHLKQISSDLDKKNHPE